MINNLLLPSSPGLENLIMSKTIKTNMFLSVYDIDKMESCIAITANISDVNANMCRLVLEKRNTHLRAESIPNRFIYEKGLLESILRNFGIIGYISEKRTRKDMIYQLIQYLLDAMNEGEGALLIIEDIQALPLSVPDEKSILSILNENKKLLQVILAGKKANMQILKSPQLKQLYQMFSAGYSLSQPRNEDIQKYLETRLMTVDSTGETIFLPETLALIRQHSLGIPCLTNFIISNSPICTFTSQITEKTEGIDQNVVCELKTHRKEIVELCPDKPPVESTIINRVRKVILNPAIVTFFVRVGTRGILIFQNIKIKRTITCPGSINLNRKSYYVILAIVVFLISVGTIVFFNSRVSDIVEISGHKPDHEVPGLNEEAAVTSGEYDKKEQDVVPKGFEKKVLFELAVYHQKKGEFVLARDQYEKLVNSYPMDHEIHNNLGSVYRELGDFDAAINAYKMAIHIKPDYHKARNNLGVVLYEEGNFQAAINEFNIILETNPEDVQCITNLGVISKKLGNPDKARKLFKEALSIDPAYKQAHYNLAVVLEESDAGKAIFHFQKYLECFNDMDFSLEEEVRQRLDVLYKKQRE